MALNVVQSPGCADLIASDLDEIVEAGGVVIDSGRIAQSLGWSPTDPDRNMSLLRVAIATRTTAIKVALDQGIDGVVRTGSPRNAARLVAQTGGSLRVIDISRAEACRKIRLLFPNNRERQALCEQGLDRYYREAD